MITQEEIPFTQEEYKAMVETIAQLRKEKKELLDKVCEWLFKNTRFTRNDILDLRKAMEE